MSDYEITQTLEINDNFHYNPRTKRFSAECSECNGCFTEVIYLRNPKTGKKVKFTYTHKDESKSEHEVYGWHFISEDGTMKFLLIND